MVRAQSSYAHKVDQNRTLIVFTSCDGARCGTWCHTGIEPGTPILHPNNMHMKVALLALVLCSGTMFFTGCTAWNTKP